MINSSMASTHLIIKIANVVVLNGLTYTAKKNIFKKKMLRNQKTVIQFTAGGGRGEGVGGRGVGGGG